MDRRVGGVMFVVATALLVASCSSSSKSSSSTAATTVAPATTVYTPTTAAAATTTVALATDATLGQILVDSKGWTLYRFTKDKGTTIACTAACTQTWPPVTVTAGTTPTGPSGLPGALGTVTRPDGTTQVTYKNWPLYRYSNDTKPGDTKGQGIAGSWYVVTATGSATGAGTTATTAGTSATTGGYGY